MSEHAFAPFVRTLGRGKRARRSLTRQEAAEAMGHILQGEVTQAQIGAFLMLLRVKEETPEELAGFLDACRPVCSHYLIGLPKADVDWPSYAGKKKHHPWYLLAARLLARNGVRVFMHGGPAHTPERHYTDESLRKLGFKLPRTVAEAGEQLHDEGFTYLGVEQFCPPLSTLLMLRFQLGLRSPINTLSRNLNPAQAALSLQSVFHPAYLNLHQEASRLCGDRNLLLFKGEGGEVEIRPDARTSIGGLRAGEPVEATLDAALPRQTPPGTVSTDHLRAVWHGEESDAYGEAAVCRTVAATLWGLGKAKDLEAATKAAQTLWTERKRDAL